MSGLSAIIIVIAMVATLGVLLVGVIGMARGGNFNRKNANKLMRARVALQALAVGLFAIVLLLIGKG
jgi:hypothetical protein